MLGTTGTGLDGPRARLYVPALGPRVFCSVFDTGLLLHASCLGTSTSLCCPWRTGLILRSHCGLRGPRYRNYSPSASAFTADSLCGNSSLSLTILTTCHPDPNPPSLLALGLGAVLSFTNARFLSAWLCCPHRTWCGLVWSYFARPSISKP